MNAPKFEVKPPYFKMNVIFWRFYDNQKFKKNDSPIEKVGNNFVYFNETQISSAKHLEICKLN